MKEVKFQVDSLGHHENQFQVQLEQERRLQIIGPGGVLQEDCYMGDIFTNMYKNHLVDGGAHSLRLQDPAAEMIELVPHLLHVKVIGRGGQATA